MTNDPAGLPAPLGSPPPSPWLNEECNAVLLEKAAAAEAAEAAKAETTETAEAAAREACQYDVPSNTYSPLGTDADTDFSDTDTEDLIDDATTVPYPRPLPIMTPHLAPRGEPHPCACQSGRHARAQKAHAEEEGYQEGEGGGGRACSIRGDEVCRLGEAMRGGTDEGSCAPRRVRRESQGGAPAAARRASRLDRQGARAPSTP